jgi:hypothetical protein
MALMEEASEASPAARNWLGIIVSQGNPADLPERSLEPERRMSEPNPKRQVVGVGPHDTEKKARAGERGGAISPSAARKREARSHAASRSEPAERRASLPEASALQ